MKQLLLVLVVLMPVIAVAQPPATAPASSPATQNKTETKKNEISLYTEIIDVITVNPDGSCKVLFDMKSPLPETPMTQGADEASKNDLLSLDKYCISNMLKKENIDAWSEISIEVTKDNRGHIKGTAYVKDFLLYAAHDTLSGLTWKKNDKGEMVLQMDWSSTFADVPTKPHDLKQEEIDTQIKAFRDNYKTESREVLMGYWGYVKYQTVFIFPGNISKVVGFTKIADGSVKWELDGKKYMEIVDKQVANDKEMVKMFKEGRTPSDMNESMCEALYGTKGLFQAVVTGELKPQFNYKSEMEKAKAAMPEMIKALKLND